LFRLAFPESFIIEVLIPQTNKNIEGEELTLSEFYVWLGVNFLIGCCEGIVDRRDWWSTDPVTDFKGAPYRMSKYISGNRYDAINAAMRFTDEEAPNFEDKLHEVRKMLLFFNSHYEQNYSPAWLSCLDESMNEWMNKFSPGFMHVPRKPHPFGNEYHTVCDGDETQGNPILWRLEIQEGKDRPRQFGKRKYEEFGANVGTMMRMCEPIFGSGKIVRMDSGFCVSKGITKLAENGVYGQALIKKRKYWPKYVPGDMIDEYMSTKAVGEACTFKQVLDGRDFFVHCMKNRDYVTKIMSCHGTLATVQSHKTMRRINGESEPRCFCYVEPLS